MANITHPTVWTFAICQSCQTPFRVFLSTILGGRGRFCSRNCAKGHCGLQHGESRTRLHGIWCHMKARCNCQTNAVYSYYGGRGIRVCEEWTTSYEAFRDWAMANGYRDDLEIDRREVNGNYEPGNCRWATRTQQMQNTRKRINAKTSQYKGVSLHSQNGTWIAQIGVLRRVVYIGSFTTEQSAARAYDEHAASRFGEFAHLNFPRKERLKR